jgi:hypothetical protein
MAGAAVGGAILLPYGCSQSDVGVTDAGSSTDYKFFKIFDLSMGLVEGLNSITPGIMINDANRILFYGGRGNDQYALYELVMDYGACAPHIETSRVVVATGQGISTRQIVQRIHRADTNPGGDLALLLDFNKTGATPSAADLETVFVESDNEFQKVVGFGDPTPDDGLFGGAFGDLALNADLDLLLVSHHTTEQNDFGHGVFAFEQSSLSAAQLVLNSGVALQGSANAFVRGFGLLDIHGDDNYVAQTQIAPPAPPATARGAGQPTGSVGGLLQVSSGLGRMATQPRVLSAPQIFGLSTEVPSEIILGPRVGSDGAAAWVGHSQNGEQQALYFRSNSRPTTEIVRSTDDGPIFSLSPPVLSSNGTLSYLQINNEPTNLYEVKVVASGAPTTVLSLNSTIDGEKPTALMYGYHSRQADSAGRIVVYAEFGEGNPAILLGIPE